MTPEMAKPKQAVSDAQDLPDKVSNWLETQGYPLEMKVASAFHGAGFTVGQSVFFVDQTAGTPREIDVVASRDVMGTDISLGIEFVIECKRSVDKPWVVFSSEHRQFRPRARVSGRVASDYGRRFLFKISRREDVQLLSLFRHEGPVAYGVTQAFTSGNDVAYAAAMSVAKAAVARVEELNASVDMFEAASIAFPVIVIEGRLFDFRLTKTGDRTLVEIERATVSWRHPSVSRHATPVQIVTEAGLKAFVTDAKAATDLLLDSRQEIDQLGAQFQRDRELREDGRTPTN